MKVYRSVWWLAVAVTLLLGLGLGRRSSPAVLFAVFVGSGIFCAFLVAFLVSRCGSHSAGGRARVAATSAVVGGTTTVSLVGYADVLGVAVFALVLVFALGSPAAVRACGRGLCSVRHPWAPRLEALTRAFYYADISFETPATSPPPLRAMSDEQLCRGWQTTSRALRRRMSPAQKGALVEERQTYLEEFERRNPSGFAAWLTSEPGTADDLMPYLRSGSAEHATINWDELTRGPD